MVGRHAPPATSTYSPTINGHLSSLPNILFDRINNSTFQLPGITTEIKVWEASEDMKTVRDSVPMAACGCTVCPNDNNVIAVVSTFRHQLPNHRDNTFIIPSAGFVSVWLLSSHEVSSAYSCGESASGAAFSEGLACNDRGSKRYSNCIARNFTYSPLPSCTFSPNSELLTSIVNSGQGTLSVLGMQMGQDGSSFDVCKLKCEGIGHQNPLCGRTVCSFFSKEGDLMATLSNVTLYSNRNVDVHELCMWSVKSDLLFHNEWQLGLDVACPAFRGYVCTGKFSPDGKYVGLSSTRGHFMLVDTKLGILATECLGYVESAERCPCLFDFDPRFKHGVIALGCWAGSVRIVRLLRERTEEHFQLKLPNDAKLCSLCYSLDGCCLALGASSGLISLLDTNSGQLVRTLGHSDCLLTRNINGSVMDVEYMLSCQELIAAYSDGVVRIWQLPRVLELQHICRLKMRTLVSASAIPNLPLPKNLIRYLLYEPIFS